MIVSCRPVEPLFEASGVAEDRFETTLTCVNGACDLRLVPVDVRTVRERSTGASYLANEDDWECECGERREDYDTARELARAAA